MVSPLYVYIYIYTALYTVCSTAILRFLNCSFQATFEELHKILLRTSDSWKLFYLFFAYQWVTRPVAFPSQHGYRDPRPSSPPEPVTRSWLRGLCQKGVVRNSEYRGFHEWGIPNSWLVYKGKTIYKWMITGGTPFSETSVCDQLWLNHGGIPGERILTTISWENGDEPNHFTKHSDIVGT